MKTKMELLDEWVGKLVFPRNLKDFIKEIKGSGTPDEVYREFCFYTDSYRYRIFAIERKNDRNYLGCTATARKSRAGESWSRGNDLADGEFTNETWIRIIESIVRYELVELSKFKQPSSVPPE